MLRTLCQVGELVDGEHIKSTLHPLRRMAALGTSRMQELASLFPSNKIRVSRSPSHHSPPRRIEAYRVSLQPHFGEARLRERICFACQRQRSGSLSRFIVHVCKVDRMLLPPYERQSELPYRPGHRYEARRFLVADFIFECTRELAIRDV